MMMSGWGQINVNYMYFVVTDVKKKSAQSILHTSVYRSKGQNHWDIIESH